MANDIAAHVRLKVTELSETMQYLEGIQLVTSEVTFAESIEPTWMLRQFFMSRAEAQWEELSTLLLKEVLPLVNDIKGMRHG